MRWTVTQALVAVAALLTPALADAQPASGSVTGKVRVTRMGKPLADASGVVVYAVGFEQPPATTVPVLRQKGAQFLPQMVAITAGQKIDFPNMDSFFHNVFSLSKARSFDLGQYKKGSSKQKTFPRPGIVEVYCNIHPKMNATILVLPNRAFAFTAADGSFTLKDVPPGAWSVFAYSRRATRPIRINKVAVTAGQQTVLSGLVIDETRLDFAHKNKYGEAYKARSGGY